MSDQIAACWVVEDWETPGVAEGDEVGFSWVVFDVQHSEDGYLLSRYA